jgi:Leucine-rich repeat (LRR) protein
LNKNKIQNANPLANLTNLAYLYLNDNQISDICWLKDLVLLVKRSLAGNRLKTFNCLLEDDYSIFDFSQEWSNLRELDLSRNKITNIDWVVYFNNLNTLDLSFNQIEDVNQLTNLYGLKSLILNGNKISNIDSMWNLGKLYQIELNGNRFSYLNFSSLKYFR